jgi:predicted transcriptional regulator
MKLNEIVQILEAEILCTVKDESHLNITMVGGADLMSDVLAFVKPGTLLLTGLTTLQVVYTAETAGISVVCFVRGKRPQGETIDLAKEKGIILLTTNISMFEGCGRLYKNGLIGCYDSNKHESFGSQM